jgi:2-haloacid dehalogenase
MNVSSNTESSQIEAVVFDLGGVLLDWDPRHLYRKLFVDEATMERFLCEICSPEWHAPHDRGVSTESSCADLAARYPDHSELIWAWSTRSEEIVNGSYDDSVDVLRAVKESGVACFALTNMEKETYPRRLDRYPFLSWFDGTLVSGQEGLAKPEPAIFLRLFERFHLTPTATVMIDDRAENLEAAGRLGMHTVLFRSSTQLRSDLERMGVLGPANSSPQLRAVSQS